MTERRRIAVLGFGEAGREIAADLVAAGADVRGFDPRVEPPPGVCARADERAAVADADLILSVNSAGDARTALENARPALVDGALWADLNTAAPSLKAALAARLHERHVAFVDVALLAPVPGRGLRTPMLVAGDGAARYAEILSGFGADVTVHPGSVGTATSRKLLRSVFYKGLAAAVVEALNGARAAGCEDWLAEHLREEFVRFDRGTLDRLVDGTHRHARRRADEMAAAAEQLRELGIEPRVTSAAHDLLVSVRDGTLAPRSSARER
jgi:3-hydroxyisobutyrate dehydrogenase-like beta-hydroxyacid dehydrogenase